jgi:hypothetical protein
MSPGPPYISALKAQRQEISSLKWYGLEDGPPAIHKFLPVPLMLLYIINTLSCSTTKALEYARRL